MDTNKKYLVRNSRLSNIVDAVYYALMPKLCVFCGGEGLICGNCGNVLEYYGYLGQLTHIRHIYAVSTYSKSTSRPIFALKYYGQKNYARPIAEIMYMQFGKIRADFLIPIPLHQNREKKRGFNQALSIAEEFSKFQKLPLYNGIIRTKDTHPQSLLTSAEKWENVSDAFCLQPGFDVVDKEIFLIDDILTSGSTICNAAKMLYSAGARSVGACVFLITPRTI